MTPPADEFCRLTASAPPPYPARSKRRWWAYAQGDNGILEAVISPGGVHPGGPIRHHLLFLLGVAEISANAELGTGLGPHLGVISTASSETMAGSTALPAGGGGSRLSWEALGSLDWHVSQGTTIRLGWRHIGFDQETRRGGTANLELGGPFLAASFRF